MLPNLQVMNMKSNVKNISIELIHLLYSQALLGTIGSFLTATFCTFISSSIIPSTSLFTWYGYTCLISVIQLVLIKSYFLYSKPARLKFWKNIFILTILLSSIGWSYSATFFIPTRDIYEVFIACAIFGICGISVSFFSASNLACIVFITPILTTFSVWCFTQRQLNCDILGLLSLLYLPLLILSSKRTNATIRNAITMKFKNQDLIHHLQNEITEHTKTEKLLRESEEQYRLVTDTLPILVSFLDENLKYRFINKVHVDWVGKPEHEIIGHSLQEVLGETAFSIFMENYEKLSTETQVSYETILTFNSDKERYVSITLIPHIVDGIRHGLFIMISDVTPRINFLATHDILTGLPNRALFLERCKHAVKRAHRHHRDIAILFLDLDHFKNVNDQLGHDAGDQLLKKVSDRLQNSLREVDTLARLGGDEFMILLEEFQNKEEVIAIAHRLCKLFTIPFEVDNHDIFITTSMGISLYNENEEKNNTTMSTLFKNADIAMYHAKELGRNTFKFYSKELDTDATKKVTRQWNSSLS